MSHQSKKSDLSQFPDKVEFVGVGEVSVKSAHIASLLVFASGLLIAIFDFPLGLVVLGFFLLIILGFEVFMIRRARNPVKITIFLKDDPVTAKQGTLDLGEINSGSIDPDMDSPEELGFRSDPKKALLVWRFHSSKEKEIAVKRLSMYLPIERADENR